MLSRSVEKDSAVTASVWPLNRAISVMLLIPFSQRMMVPSWLPDATSELSDETASAVIAAV